MVNAIAIGGLFLLAILSGMLGLGVPLLVVGAIGSYLGARVAARWVPGERLKQLFGLLIVVVTAYRVWKLF
jgi:hypothetical protein